MSQVVTESAVDLSPYRAHIESALLYCDASHRYEDVEQMIAAGHAQAWTGPASIFVTEHCSQPRSSYLNIFLAAGEIRELTAMLPGILEWAKAKGASYATFTGRRGWLRHPVIKAFGFEPSPHVTMVRPL